MTNHLRPSLERAREYIEGDVNEYPRHARPLLAEIDAALVVKDITPMQQLRKILDEEIFNAHFARVGSPAIESLVLIAMSRAAIEAAAQARGLSFDAMCVAAGEQSRIDQAILFTAEDRIRRMLKAALSGTVNRDEIDTMFRGKS